MIWTGPRARSAVALLLLVAGCAGPKLPAVHDGDLIFQTSRSEQSEAIQRATGSRYSHMGLVFVQNGRPVVLEAVSTVRYTPLERWIARGEGGHYIIERLRRRMTANQLERLRTTAASFVGIPYDAAFGWSDQRMYCSELAWKVYQRSTGLEIGELQRLGNFHLEDPVVRETLHSRYGNHIPFDETVISPSAMFGSRLLTTVATK